MAWQSQSQLSLPPPYPWPPGMQVGASAEQDPQPLRCYEILTPEGMVSAPTAGPALAKGIWLQQTGLDPALGSRQA